MLQNYDICMAFSSNKCNKLTVKKRKIIQSEPITMADDQQIKSLEVDQHYCYLGKRLKTCSQMKSILIKEYFSCIKMILKSELSSKNTIDVINSYAVPALSYGFSVLHWNITEIEKVDREKRKVIQSHCLMHQQSDITLLYTQHHQQIQLNC